MALELDGELLEERHGDTWPSVSRDHDIGRKVHTFYSVGKAFCLLLKVSVSGINGMLAVKTVHEK